MDVGVLYWATDETVPPVEFAVAAEERGFESFWLGDHTHVPIQQHTAYSSPSKQGLGLAEGDIPREYRRLVDPLISLAAVAAVTSTIRLGTGVCLVAQRDPILLAKETATIDRLSSGRLLFGVGFGWSVEEMRAHGVDATHRHAIVREKVAALRSLWTEEQAAFTGRYVDLQPSWMWPKPAQLPHPPILVGGGGPVAIRHAVEYGDGWMPVAGGLSRKLDALRAACEQAHRDPRSVPVTVTSPQPVIDALEHYRDIGVSRVVLWVPPPADRDGVLRLLDEWAPWIARVAS